MKVVSLLALAAAGSLALSLPNDNQAPLNGGNAADVEKYLLELSPGETLWATEEEKWALKRVCHTGLSLAEDSA
jgi:bacterial leucyl aminopeptidase